LQQFVDDHVVDRRLVDAVDVDGDGVPPRQHIGERQHGHHTSFEPVGWLRPVVEDHVETIHPHLVDEIPSWLQGFTFGAVVGFTEGESLVDSAAMQAERLEDCQIEAKLGGVTRDPEIGFCKTADHGVGKIP